MAFLNIAVITIATSIVVIIPAPNIDDSGSPAISAIFSLPVITSGSSSPENFISIIMLMNWYRWFVHCIPVPNPVTIDVPIVDFFDSLFFVFIYTGHVYRKI